MKTKPLYLEDSYVKEFDASILEVIPDGENKYKIVLDQTYFYPMGGGQPTDQGTLELADQWQGKVYLVRVIEGEVYHFIETTAVPSPGESLHAVLNWDRRYKYMKIHTAGHIIDFAVYKLGLSPKKLVPTKGDHGKKPFILYTGQVHQDFQSRLQDEVNKMVAESLSLSTEFLPLEQLEQKAIYLQPNLPKNKPLRSLTLEGVGTVADGGTQLKTTAEAGEIIIDSIELESGNTIIRYSVR